MSIPSYKCCATSIVSGAEYFELQDEEQKASPFKATLDKYCVSGRAFHRLCRNFIKFDAVQPVLVQAEKASPFKATLDKYCDKKAKICSKEQSDAALEALAKGKFTVGAVKRSVARGIEIRLFGHIVRFPASA